MLFQTLDTLQDIILAKNTMLHVYLISFKVENKHKNRFSFHLYYFYFSDHLKWSLGFS